jgi:hypothetical protein
MMHIPANVRLGPNNERLMSSVDVVPPRVWIDGPVGWRRTASTAIGLISLAFSYTAGEQEHYTEQTEFGMFVYCPERRGNVAQLVVGRGCRRAVRRPGRHIGEV